MNVVDILLLFAAICFILIKPFKIPPFVAPIVLSGVGLLLGVVRLKVVYTSAKDLANPLLFLIFIVPLAKLLDELGFFQAAAELALKAKNFNLQLYILAIVTCAFLNLDTCIVLLTPLYLEVAERTKQEVETVCAIPFIVAFVGSSFLPISNLTNLIVVSSFKIQALEFFKYLAIPSVAACISGWFLFKQKLQIKELKVTAKDFDKSALLKGVVVILILAFGFVLGPYFGIEHFETAIFGDIILIILTRKIPVKKVPAASAALVAGLGPLALSAFKKLPFTNLVVSKNPLWTPVTAAMSGIIANSINNLPATLVVSGTLSKSTFPGIWAFLLGTNMASSVLFTGSLAAILWRALLKSFSVHMKQSHILKLSFTVILPSFSLATGLLLIEEVLFYHG